MLRIEKLYLQGFKSFNDPTEVIFDQHGITAVVGPNGCGKCVDGDTLVTLADGRDVTIRELVESALRDSTGVEAMDDGTLTRSNPHNVEILSLNPITFRIEPRAVSAFIKRTTTPYLLHIRTRSGREVVATPYHPLFTLKNGAIRALKAEELHPGVQVLVPNLAAQNQRTLDFALEGQPGLLQSRFQEPICHISYEIWHMKYGISRSPCRKYLPDPAQTTWIDDFATALGGQHQPFDFAPEVQLKTFDFVPEGQRRLAGGGTTRIERTNPSRPEGTPDNKFAVAKVVSCAPSGRDNLLARVPVVPPIGIYTTFGANVFAAVPPDVRKVFDLPRVASLLHGAAPPRSALQIIESEPRAVVHDDGPRLNTTHWGIAPQRDADVRKVEDLPHIGRRSREDIGSNSCVDTNETSSCHLQGSVTMSAWIHAYLLTCSVLPLARRALSRR